MLENRYDIFTLRSCVMASSLITISVFPINLDRHVISAIQKRFANYFVTVERINSPGIDIGLCQTDQLFLSCSYQSLISTMAIDP